MTDTPPVEFQDYQCERCEYKYTRRQDFPPHLCTRCSRFLAKSVWKAVHQLQPSTHVPVEPTI